MNRRNQCISASVVLIMMVGVVSGCSSTSAESNEVTAQASASDGSMTAQDHSQHTEHEVTTINGEVPPNTPTMVTDSTIILDVVQDGQRHLVYRDERPPGTRAPIHEHPYGGATCMISGEMTLYLEGSEPQVAGPGDCYWMPPGLPMTGVNSGDEVAVLHDMFTVPDGQAVWIVVEAGQKKLQENFGSGSSNGM
jgi:quercetin dioxygenase-like cupin family protein